MEDTPLIIIDFKTTYLGKYWISNWSKDESYPEGYRYKLLSNINREESSCELVVVIEESNGDKTEMSRMDVQLDALDRVAHTFTEGLSTDFNLDFDMQDYSHIDNADDFEKAIYKTGWHDYESV